MQAKTAPKNCPVVQNITSLYIKVLLFLLQAIEDRLRVSVKELLKFEFQAVVALEFDLHIPRWEVLPHAKRLETE